MTLEEAKAIRACNGRGYSTIEFIKALQLTEPNPPKNCSREGKEMITEDYVSFEVAKLLKEKGFDWMESPFYSEQDRDEWRQANNYTMPNPHYDPEVPFDTETSTMIAPHVSLQMAMKWLQEAFNIIIIPNYEYEYTSTPWCYKIFKLGENGKPERVAVKGVSYDKDNNPTEHIVGYRDYERSYKDYATKEEAVEEGIKYCLENLI